MTRRLPGEKHLPGYSYCGPGTRLKDRESLGAEYTTPINCLDSVCKKHDYDYQKISESKYKTKDDLRDDVLRADQMFKARIKACPPGNAIAKRFITGIFNVKNLFEKINLADPARFVEGAEVEAALKGLNLIPKKKKIIKKEVKKEKKTKKIVKKKVVNKTVKKVKK